MLIATPRGHVLTMSAARLAPVYEAEGPFVTAYLDAPPAVENASARLETTWKNVRRDLSERGVDEATVDALEAAVGDGEFEGTTQVLVASHGRVHLSEWLPEPAPADGVTVEALPHLLPYVAASTARVPCVVVLTDRQGADVVAYSAGPNPVGIASTGDVAPWPYHKTGIGGWASKRYDASVEESWERGARSVAELVQQVADDVQPRLVIGCGDERAISLLREHLPVALLEKFVVIPGGGRHVDGGDAHIEHRIAEAVAETVAEDEVSLLESFRQACGRGDLAREGVADVVAALQVGQVETLLLTGSAAGAATASFGPEPTQLAMTDADLVAMGVGEPQHAPLVDVLLRAALGTGADVSVISGRGEGAPSGGVGAVLRYDLESTAGH